MAKKLQQLITDFCTYPRIGNKNFSLQFCTFRDVYGHFHISIQIKVPLMERKKGWQTYSLRRFLGSVSLARQQQILKPRETTCPLRDLVQGCLILTFIGTLYQQSRVLLNRTEFILYGLDLRPLSKLRKKESHHSPGLYNLETGPHFEVFQDRSLSPLLRSYLKGVLAR